MFTLVFMKMVRPSSQIAIQLFVDVLEQAKTFEKVTFVGEVANFVDQIKKAFQSNYLVVFPSAQLIGRLGLSLPSVDVDAFVPTILETG